LKKIFEISVKNHSVKRKKPARFDRAVHFNRLGNFTKPAGEGKVFNEKICCCGLRSERLAWDPKECLLM